MKVASIFLAVSVALSAAPALAGGSMAPSVRVIVVDNPKAKVERLYRDRERAAEKAETKRRLDEGKALVKRMEKADRDYQKKMDNWAKDLKKKKRK